MTEETPKKPRRKRRTKAQIEADKAAKAAAAAEVEKMEAAGYKHVRLRDERGHFIKDDPSTPENEAWEWVKVEEEKEEECIPCNEAAAAALEAAEAALEKEVEMNFGSSYEKEVDAISEEEPVVSPEPKVVDDDPIVDGAGRRLSEIHNRFKARRARKRLGLL